MSRWPLPRKRFRKAYSLAWTATFVAIALAGLPALFGSVTYSPELAVLTATLVALIWSAYLTYTAVNNEPVTRLESFVNLSPSGFDIELKNIGIHRVWITPKLSYLSVLGPEVADAPFTGDEDDPIVLYPGDRFQGHAPIADLRARLDGKLSCCLATLRISWRDIVGDTGSRGEAYSFQADGHAMSRLYTAAEVRRASDQITSTKA